MISERSTSNSHLKQNIALWSQPLLGPLFGRLATELVATGEKSWGVIGFVFHSQKGPHQNWGKAKRDQT